MLVWKIVEIFFLIVISIQVFYLAFFSIAGLFPRRRKVFPSAGEQHRIGVVIPGYREDRIIVSTAQQALAQSYPREQYEVVICADSFLPETTEALRKLGVTVLEVQFENSTKAKSINKALEYLESTKPGIVVILDADNVMEHDFLHKVNNVYHSGSEVIQGHRTAKNQDTPFALLDAINEEISNTIFRKGHRRAGMSSALIGSAMAFDFRYFRKIMAGIEDVAGEDKLIELRVLKDRQTIEYLEEAYVYDEKITHARNFSKQRTRWVGVQLYFFRHYFGDGIKELLLEGNIDYFNKAFQMSLIPKVLLIGITGVLGILSIWVPLYPLWLGLMLLYFLTLLLAIPGRYYNRQLIIAVLNIPRAIFFMLLSVSRIRRSTASKFEVTEKKLR